MTLTTRRRSPGTFFCRIHAAARVSCVGTSPAQAITTSGLAPTVRPARVSLPAHSQMDAPAAACLRASSRLRYCGCSCLSMTRRLT